jgi:predicted Zn-dependent peptidase
MTYTKITPFIHLITNSCDRPKLDIEIVMTAGGSVFEAEQDRGRKHLMEHCIATRTQSMDMKTFKDWQFRESIMINAYTSPTVLAVNATTHPTKFQIAFEACAEMIFNPCFDQEVLDQEREIVLREISERSGNPEYITYYHTMNQIFEPNSLDSHETLGSAEAVAKTTVEDMIRLHHQNLQNSHIIIKVSGGGVDTDFIQSKIQDYLAQNDLVTTQDITDSSSKLAIDYRPFNSLKTFGYQPVVHELAHEHSELTIFIPCTVEVNNKATRKFFDELFMRFYGKLYHRLRDEKGYIYSMYSQFREDLNMLEINLSCEIEYIEPVVDQIKAIFGNWAENFDEQKFLDFKNIIKIKLDMANDSINAITKFVESGLIEYGVAQSFQEYEQELDSVTASDIEQFYQDIQKNLPKMQVVAVSKSEQIKEKFVK